jgi:general secretion pathway protein K
MISPRSLGSREQSGFALIIVLWVVALLALLGTQLLVSGRSDAQLARNLVDSAKLATAADGAVQQAIFDLLLPPPKRWLPDGSTHTLRIGDSAITLRVTDETGKINPNIAGADLLTALLNEVGMSPQAAASLAAAIVDWRSATSESSAAAAAKYAAAGRDYGPPGRPFRAVDELALVLGMTPSLLETLRPHLTVWTNSDPDGRTQDPVVAAALGYPQAPAGGETGPMIVTIAVRAGSLNGATFAERVAVRVNPLPGHPPYEILDLSR